MGLIQKREIAHMMHENITQNRQLRIDWRDLAKLGLERGAEAVQGSGRIQLGDFVTNLVADKFALEI